MLLLLLLGCAGPSDLPKPHPAPSLAPPDWSDGAEVAEPTRQTYVAGTIDRIDEGVRAFEMTDADGGDWTITVALDGHVRRDDEALAFTDLTTGMQVRTEGRIGNGQVLANAVDILGVPSPDAEAEAAPEEEPSSEQEAP